MDKDWLIKKFSVEEVEEYELEQLKKRRPDWIGTDLCKPFGMRANNWIDFKSRITEGVELWNFSSDALSWGSLCGRAGYALVENDEVIDTFTTRLS